MPFRGVRKRSQVITTLNLSCLEAMVRTRAYNLLICLINLMKTRKKQKRKTKGMFCVEYYSMNINLHVVAVQ